MTFTPSQDKEFEASSSKAPLVFRSSREPRESDNDALLGLVLPDDPIWFVELAAGQFEVVVACPAMARQGGGHPLPRIESPNDSLDGAGLNAEPFLDACSLEAADGAQAPWPNLEEVARRIIP